MKTLRFILVLVCCVGLVDGLALAQGKKRKRKKRKPVATEQSDQSMSGEGEGEASMGTPSGDGSHGEQDKPGPYVHELAMDFNFSSSSKTITVGDVENDGESALVINLKARYHYILGPMGPGSLGVGPIISIENKSTTLETLAGDVEGSKMTLGIGASAVYYIGDIQTQKLLWFAGANAIYNSKSGTTNDVDDAGISGFEMGLDGGAYYFLDAGVAIKGGAYFKYDLSTEEALAPATDDEETTTMSFGIMAGLSSFF